MAPLQEGQPVVNLLPGLCVFSLSLAVKHFRKMHLKCSFMFFVVVLIELNLHVNSQPSILSEEISEW